MKSIDFAVNKRETMSQSLRRLGVGTLAGVLALLASNQERAAAQAGRFLAVMNEQSSNSDSKRSVTYFDADDLASGPMFSVFMGYEQTGGAEYEELSAIDVNPATGDVYVLSGDSGQSPAENPNSLGFDTTSDLDLYKIDFANVFNHWTTNFKGKNVRTLTGPLAVGDALPQGAKNSLNLDYVTYGINNPYGDFPFDATHSNTFVLPGAVNKIGEVKKNLAPENVFFPYSMEFIDEETLFFLDESSAPAATDTAATDHEFRVIERVSTSPGAANGAVADFLDGGFNRGTSESWNSRRIAKVNLDFDGVGAPLGHSEPESTAYFKDPVTGVRGVWVTESEGAAGGDDIAFLQLDANNNSLGYRPYAAGGFTFALDDNPAVNANANNGKADNIFVDSDTGDLIIMESGFGDVPTHEPSVFRREVISYDDGNGAIQFGAWGQKIILNPTKTPGESTAFLERGQWTAYDSENDLIFVVNPGNAAPENPAFQMDIWVIDVNTGVTTSFLDLDDSVSLFNGDAFGDKVAFFSLGSAPAEDADFNNDGVVDGSDFLVWQRGFGSGNSNLTGDADGDGVVDGDDLVIWKSQFGVPAVAAAGAVPEPATIAMGMLGAFAFAASRHRNK